MKKNILLLALIGIIFLAGCITNKSEEAKTACIRECQLALSAGRNLTDGPCLSNEIIKDWVCDVAHSPRIPEIDNKPENQCTAWQVTAHHFVEVDPNCNFIRSV
jgi:hypothetical protein